MMTYRDHRVRQRDLVRPAAVPAATPVAHNSDLAPETLRDLLDLDELGAGVSWPSGLDSRTARIILEQRGALPD